MNRRAFVCGCLGCLAAPSLFAANLQPRLTPGFRPESASEEMNLWDLFEKEEKKLKHSRFLVRDPELNAYVAAIACRLAGDYCRDMRVYLVRSPYFNATMAPNGMMQIWTGALLRCQNEAQLAAVIGHEIGHYLRRHGVERFRDARQKSALSLILGLGLSAAGGGHFGALADGILLATTSAYTRDHEREADSMGVELCSRAGFDPGEASKVWAHLIAEREARENPGMRDVIFATHPSEDEREETLRALAKNLEGCGDEARQGRERYHRALVRERSVLFAEELKLRDYGATLALFQRMAKDDPDDLDVAFNVGEVYRLRAREGDDAKALECFERLAAHEKAPAATWRSIGLVKRARGQAAAPDFRRYLERAPRADDATIIESYIASEART